MFELFFLAFTYTFISLWLTLKQSHILSTNFNNRRSFDWLTFLLNLCRTKEECERVCPPTVTTTQSTPVDTCQQPLVTGLCRADIPRWGSRDGKCVQFTYGGCGRNDNNFG